MCYRKIEMENQFKKDSWAWIAGLQGAKEFNGKLGQIIKFRLMIRKKSLLLHILS